MSSVSAISGGGEEVTLDEGYVSDIDQMISPYTEGFGKIGAEELTSKVQPSLKVVKLSEHAKLPTKKTPKSAGYDLYSAQNILIPAKKLERVLTDLKISLPDGSYGRIAPKSGLTVKKFMDIKAGVIDADYRGNVEIVIFNFGNTSLKISRGDVIAQLICEAVIYPELEEVQDLDKTERGCDGFGCHV